MNPQGVPGVLGGMALPWEPPPLKEEALLHAMAGVPARPGSSALPPLGHDGFLEALRRQGAAGAFGTLEDLRNARRQGRSLLPEGDPVEGRLLAPFLDAWLGPESLRLLDREPVGPGDPGTPDGLCWCSQGGRTAALLLSMLATSDTHHMPLLLERAREHAEGGFHPASRDLFLGGDAVRTAQARIRSLVPLHARSGSLVAALALEAAGRDGWTPWSVSWMRMHARGAWLLVSAGSTRAAWPEVRAARLHHDAEVTRAVGSREPLMDAWAP